MTRSRKTRRAKAFSSLQRLDEEWLRLEGAEGEHLPKPASNRYRWYINDAYANRAKHRVSEALLIFLTASVPALAALGAPTGAMAIFGGLATMVIGLRQLYQWHAGWLSSASTAVDIQREIAAWNQGSEPYTAKDRSRILVERIERCVSSETVRWEEREKSGVGPPTDGGED